jgi:hypothetical protein
MSHSAVHFNRFLLSYLLPGLGFVILLIYFFDLAFTNFILLKIEASGLSKIMRELKNSQKVFSA